MRNHLILDLRTNGLNVSRPLLAHDRPKDMDDAVPMDEETVTNFYISIYDDLSIGHDENQELYDFFRDTFRPDSSALVSTRAMAFKVACDYLADDKETNIQLLRCVNVVIHAFEQSCLKPKPMELKLDVEEIDFEAMSLQDAVQKLWDLDVNRLDPGVDYELNVQRGKKPYWKEDNAADPLFTSIDKKSVYKRPTYKAFHALLDNYTAETGHAEVVTNAERREIWTFLDAIMETGPMLFCHSYCRAKDPDRVPSSKKEFQRLLHKIWFELYRRERGGRQDSSGFEHVFVGEVKDGDVSGFHNWIQLAIEEESGRLDYRGYIKPKSRNSASADSNDHLLTIQFRWNGVEKFVGTSFIGVSPEFEMALYTLCFLSGEQENNVDLSTGTDTFGLKIKCYTMARDKIGTAFPEVTSHYEE